jgi:hypothetical protein
MTNGTNSRPFAQSAGKESVGTGAKAGTTLAAMMKGSAKKAFCYHPLQ